MNTSSIKRSIGQCDDAAALSEIKVACIARIKLLSERAFEAKKSKAWNAIKDAKHGDTLHSHWTGFGGKGILNGDRLTVHVLQPRKQLLWVVHPRKADQFIALRPSDVAVYDIRKEPVDKPISDTARASHAAFNDVLAEVCK